MARSFGIGFFNGALMTFGGVSGGIVGGAAAGAVFTGLNNLLNQRFINSGHTIDYDRVVDAGTKGLYFGLISGAAQPILGPILRFTEDVTGAAVGATCGMFPDSGI